MRNNESDIILKIEALLSQAKTWADTIKLEFQDEIALKRIIASREVYQEIQVLEGMLALPLAELKIVFHARCAFRQHDGDNTISIASDPDSETNRLYFQIAHVLFEPTDLRALLTILMPKVTTLVNVLIPTETPSHLSLKDQKECHQFDQPTIEVTDLSALNHLEASLENVKACVFHEDRVMCLAGAVLLSQTLEWHIKCCDILQSTFPALAQKVYTHNAAFKRLSADVQYLKSGLSPYYIFKELMWGLRLGGARYSRDEHTASESAMISIQRFFDHYLAWPAALKEAIHHVERLTELIDSMRKYDEFKEPICVETLAKQIETMLIKNAQNHLFTRIPTYSPEETQALSKQYRTSTLDVTKDANLSPHFPTEIVTQVANGIEINNVEHFVWLLKSVSLAVYDGIFASMLPKIGGIERFEKDFARVLKGEMFDAEAKQAILLAIIRSGSLRDHKKMTKMLSKKITLDQAKACLQAATTSDDCLFLLGYFIRNNAKTKLHIPQCIESVKKEIRMSVFVERCLVLGRIDGHEEKEIHNTIRKLTPEEQNTFVDEAINIIRADKEIKYPYLINAISALENDAIMRMIKAETDNCTIFSEILIYGKFDGTCSEIFNTRFSLLCRRLQYKHFRDLDAAIEYRNNLLKNAKSIDGMLEEHQKNFLSELTYPNSVPAIQVDHQNLADQLSLMGVMRSCTDLQAFIHTIYTRNTRGTHEQYLLMCELINVLIQRAEMANRFQLITNDNFFLLRMITSQYRETGLRHVMIKALLNLFISLPKSRREALLAIKYRDANQPGRLFDVDQLLDGGCIYIDEQLMHSPSVALEIHSALIYSEYTCQFEFESDMKMVRMHGRDVHRQHIRAELRKRFMGALAIDVNFISSMIEKFYQQHLKQFSDDRMIDDIPVSRNAQKRLYFFHMRPAGEQLSIMHKLRSRKINYFDAVMSPVPRVGQVISNIKPIHDVLLEAVSCDYLSMIEELIQCCDVSVTTVFALALANADIGVMESLIVGYFGSGYFDKDFINIMGIFTQQTITQTSAYEALERIQVFDLGEQWVEAVYESIYKYKGNLTKLLTLLLKHGLNPARFDQPISVSHSITLFEHIIDRLEADANVMVIVSKEKDYKSAVELMLVRGATPLIWNERYSVYSRLKKHFGGMLYLLKYEAEFSKLDVYQSEFIVVSEALKTATNRLLKRIEFIMSSKTPTRLESQIELIDLQNKVNRLVEMRCMPQSRQGHEERMSALRTFAKDIGFCNYAGPYVTIDGQSRQSIGTIAMIELFMNAFHLDTMMDLLKLLNPALLSSFVTIDFTSYKSDISVKMRPEHDLFTKGGLVKSKCSIFDINRLEQYFVFKGAHLVYLINMHHTMKHYTIKPMHFDEASNALFAQVNIKKLLAYHRHAQYSRLLLSQIDMSKITSPIDVMLEKIHPDSVLNLIELHHSALTNQYGETKLNELKARATEMLSNRHYLFKSFFFPNQFEESSQRTDQPSKGISFRQ